MKNFSGCLLSLQLSEIRVNLPSEIYAKIKIDTPEPVNPDTQVDGGKQERKGYAQAKQERN